jgi:hypothetical protein
MKLENHFGCGLRLYCRRNACFNPIALPQLAATLTWARNIQYVGNKVH